MAAVVLSLIIGFIIGTLALALGGYDPVKGFSYMFTGVFSAKPHHAGHSGSVPIA